MKCMTFPDTYIFLVAADETGWVVVQMFANLGMASDKEGMQSYLGSLSQPGMYVTENSGGCSFSKDTSKIVSKKTWIMSLEPFPSHDHVGVLTIHVGVAGTHV